MIPFTDHAPPRFSEPGLQGWYYAPAMATCVTGLDHFCFTDDLRANGVAIHEYMHHLQFCATTAGLCYQQAAVGSVVALLTLASELRRATGALVPASAAEIIAGSRSLGLVDRVRRLESELLFRRSMLGWPQQAAEWASIRIGVIGRNDEREVLGAGMLLLAEGNARSVQTKYLFGTDSSRETDDAIRERTDLDGETFKMYLALRYGFEDALGIRDPFSSLFDWICAKALMPPHQPYPSDQAAEETAAAADDWKRRLAHEPFFPGRRYAELYEALRAGAHDARMLCAKERYDDLDECVSRRLGWKTSSQVIDALEVEGKTLPLGLLRRLVLSAVACHRSHPWFLTNPIPHVGGLISLLPPFNWARTDGSFWLSDWCTESEREEIATVTVTSLLASSLEVQGPMTCPWSDCCMPEHARGANVLSAERVGVKCAVDLQLRSACGLSSSDFRARETGR